MSNGITNTELIDKAIIFATKAHAGTSRKGKTCPYIVHPLEVVSIIATMSEDQALLAAGVLHDTVEDCNVTIEEIEREFGKNVAHLVNNETDKAATNVPENAEWKERKKITLQRIADAERDSKIVALGDKLSNMRAIARDYDTIGEKLWERFKCKSKTEYGWYYCGLAESLKELSDTNAYAEFTDLIKKVFL